MASRRRNIALVSALVAVGALLFGWFLWLPAEIKTRAEKGIRERTGLSARVGSVSLGLGVVSLEQVKIGDHASFRVEIPRIDARLRLDTSIRRLRVIEPLFRLDLRDAQAEGDLHTLMGRLSRMRGSREPPTSRAEVEGTLVSVARGRGEVFDNHGRLASVHGLTGTVDRRGIMLGTRSVVLGSAPGDVLDLAESKVVLHREPGDWKVFWLSTGSGRAVLAERGESTGPPPPELTKRLTAVLAAVRPRRSAADSAEPSTREPGPMSAGFERLAEGFQADLRGLMVRVRSGADERELVRSLHLACSVASEDSLKIAGGGAPSAGGKLDWDLRVWPAELRGEGKVAFERLPLALAAPFLPNVPWHEPDRATLDGEVVLSAAEPGALAVRGRVNVLNAALASPRIAPNPVRGISAAVEGRGEWNYRARRLELEEASLTIDDARVLLRGNLEFAADHYVIDVVATLPPTDCNAAVHAIPRDLLADVAGFSWTGNMAGRITARVDSRHLDDTVLDIDVTDACTFEMVPPVARVERFREPFLHSVTEPDGAVFEFMTGPGSEAWVSIEAMSPFFVHAVLAHEDASFFAHHGFAPWSIRDALVRNLEEGRFAVGASTIVMQLVKNLFLKREKTLARKAQEVILTWWIDHALTKQDTLELYLNIIEYGPGIYGVRQAARHYFGRSVSELSLAEGAFLATLLPAPKRYYGNYVRGSLSVGTATSMRQLLQHMFSRARIDEAALAYGLEEIDKFAFVPEGGVPLSRTLAGQAAPLPLRVGPDADWEADVDAEDEFPTEESDGW